MENVYMYGPAAGRPFTEDRLDHAAGRKGRLRAAMSHDLLTAHTAGRVEVTIGRASDYYGPRGGAQSNLRDRVFTPALTGKTATILGDPNQPHTYTYIPDIAEGLAVLGEHPQAPGQIWHLPNDAHTRTTRDLVTLAYQAAGHRTGKLRATPNWLIRGLARVNPTARELTELLYEFDEPFIVDSTKITTQLGITATPYPTAIEHTLAAYHQHHSP